MIPSHQRAKRGLLAAHTRACSPAWPGDFWHVRGALPVHPLNAVIEELQQWDDFPFLMIPGNHDQVRRPGQAGSGQASACA